MSTFLFTSESVNEGHPGRFLFDLLDGGRKNDAVALSSMKITFFVVGWMP